MVGLSDRINSPTTKSLEATRPTPAPSTWVTLYAGDMIRGHLVAQFRIKENNCWGQTILPGGNRCRFLHLEYMPMRRLKRKGFLKTLREKKIVTHNDEEA